MSFHRTRRPCAIPAALLLPVLLALVAGCSPGASPHEEVHFVLPGTLIDNTEYAARRARLMDEIPDGIAIIPGISNPKTNVIANNKVREVRRFLRTYR